MKRAKPTTSLQGRAGVEVENYPQQTRKTLMKTRKLHVTVKLNCLPQEELDQKEVQKTQNQKLMQ